MFQHRQTTLVRPHASMHLATTTTTTTTTTTSNRNGKQQQWQTTTVTMATVATAIITEMAMTTAMTKQQ